MAHERECRIPQDLHIHTVYSTGDSAVVPEQTVAFISRVAHARVVGISDHFEFLAGETFARYEAEVRAHNLRVGTEVNGAEWVKEAMMVNADYYIFHCLDRNEDYCGAEDLLSTGKPVIIAHPLVMGTDLYRVPTECFVEINNRYVWRHDWRSLRAHVNRFKFVLGSDAHQPNWLNVSVARYVAEELGIRETILFPNSD